MYKSDLLNIGLITGCGKGIGLSITKKLLSDKNNKVILGISRTSSPDIKILIKKYKKRFIFEEIDINETEKLKLVLNVFQQEYGAINFAICNAGIRSRMPMIKCELELYRKVMETNTIANINIAKELIENCIKNKSKCNILFISSIVGARGFDELTTYAVSKSALEGFMRSAAIEVAKNNIQINCLATGFIESSYADEFKKNRKDLYRWTIEQTPMGRWGKCEEIAELALFLISDKNSYMTGSVIYSDGGWNAK